jgi:hypothetical protein
MTRLTDIGHTNESLVGGPKNAKAIIHEEKIALALLAMIASQKAVNSTSKDLRKPDSARNMQTPMIRQVKKYILGLQRCYRVPTEFIPLGPKADEDF